MKRVVKIKLHRGMNTNFKFALFFLLVILILFQYALLVSTSTSAQIRPQGFPKALELVYAYTPIESHSHEGVYSHLGSFINNIKTISNTYSSDLRALGGLVASKLGLRGYEPRLIVRVSPLGAPLYNESCYIYASNISAIVEVWNTNLRESLVFRNAMLACYGPPSAARRLASNILASIGARGSLEGFNVTYERARFEGVAVYIGRFNVSASGRVDWGRWAVLDSEGRYEWDFPYLLPPLVNGTGYMYLYEKPMDQEAKLFYEKRYNVAPDGYAGLYGINTSVGTRLNYTVRGLGRVPYFDTTCTPAVRGLTMSAYTVLVTSSPSDALRLAKLVRSRFSRYDMVKVNDSVVWITNKAYLSLTNYLSGHPRYWGVGVINETSYNLSIAGVRILKMVGSVIAVRVDGRLLVPAYELRDTVYVYSKSKGVLLEASSPLFLNRGLSVVAGLAWERLANSTGTGHVWLSVGSLTGTPLSARLVEARGLGAPSLLAVEARAGLSWPRALGAAALLALAVAVPLYATRRPLAALGLLALALGAGVVVVYHSVIVPGGFRVVASGEGGAPIAQEFYVYGWRGDTIELVASGECFYNASVNVAGGGKSWRASASNVAGSLSGRVGLGDPRIYNVTIELRGGRACRGLSLLVSGRGSSGRDSLRGLVAPGLALALAGAALAALGFWVRGRRGGLWAWHLEASYLYAVSAAIAWVLLYTYSMAQRPCKLGGFCITNISPRALLLRVSELPLQAYVILALYAVIVAAILYGYHHESGLDRRLYLLGAGRARLQAYKLASLVALVALPYASARILLGVLVDPSVALGTLYPLVAGSLASGVIVALVYGGATALLGIALGRLSYTLLVAAPAAVVAVSTMGIRAQLAFESLPLKLAVPFTPIPRLLWYHVAAALVVVPLLLLAGSWRGREL